MTKGDVISTAFERDIATTKIPDDLIDSVQQRHIMPMLGEDFYDDLVANQANYTTLIAYLKPVLAFYVAYYTLPKIYNEIGSTGIAQIQGKNRQQANKGDLVTMQNYMLDAAEMYAKRLAKYLDDNSSSFSLYSKGDNPVEQISIIGGIIFEEKTSEEDDYTINL